MTTATRFSDAAGLGSIAFGDDSWTMLECTHFPPSFLSEHFVLKLSVVGHGVPELGEQTAFVSMAGEVITTKVDIVAAEPREHSLICDLTIWIREEYMG